MDAGFNFRSTLAYVTDPANTQFVGGYAYPQTSGGVTFGWSTVPPSIRNRSTSVDARIAGCHVYSNSAAATDFKVDLPAAGQYDIVIALGDAGFAGTQYLEVYDGATLLLTIPTTNTAAGSFVDASGATYTAANFFASQTPARLTFSGTQAIFRVGGGVASNNTAVSHIRLTSVSSGGTTHDGTATLSGTGTTSGAAKLTAKGSAAVSGTGTLAATVKLNRKGAAALSGTGTLAATAKATRNAAALLAGTSTLTATATTSSGQSGSASFSGAGTMSAAATLSAGAAASLTGTGAVSGAARAVRGASATLMGQGALNALARLETNAAAVLAGVGTMTAVGRSEAPRRATTSLRLGGHSVRPRQVSGMSRPAAISRSIR